MDVRWREAPEVRRLAAIVTAIAVLLPNSARADDRIRKEAERRNRVASAAYNQGRYEAALQMYQSAYDLFPSPKYLFNIGLAKEKTFDYEGCALAFRDFLRQTEDGGEKAVRQAAETRQATCLQKTSIPVRLTSVPTNAAVYLGEGESSELRGRTPQQLMLPPGKHTVTVQLQGYVAQEQVVDVQLGTRPQADFVLEKLSSLRVEVDPPGAKVSIAGAAWEAAPVEKQVRAGALEVRVKKDGYEPAQRQVKVESGQEVSVVLSLRELPKIRNLSVQTEVTPGVSPEVQIDGERLGPSPTQKPLGPGAHRVKVSAPGYLPFAESIKVPEERDVRLFVKLERRRSRTSRTVFWSLLGAAGAAALVGSGYGILALSDQAEFNDDKTNVEVHERGEVRAERADWGFGAAAVLGAGALVYYYLTRPPSSSAEIE